jgi:hypothetical protein
MTRAARTEASLFLSLARWTLVLAGLQAAATAALLLDVARAFA